MKLLLPLIVCLLHSVLADVTLEEKKVWEAVGAFGHTLTQTLVSLTPDENVLISPFSIGTALSTVLIGAGGSTKQELVKTLNFQEIDDDSLRQSFSALLSRKHGGSESDGSDSSFELQSANALYLGKIFNVKQGYINDVQQNFHADVATVDFTKDAEKIKNEINSFANNKTHGLIESILQKPLSRDTITALINTVYFKGEWSKQMSEDKTTRVFNKGCGLRQSNHSKWLRAVANYPYLDSKALQARLILLPFDGDKFQTEMLIVLPNSEHNCITNDWFSRLSWLDIKAELKKLKFTTLDLTIPAFEIGNRYELQNVLPSVGIKKAFSPYEANFTKIIDENDFVLDQVIHQTKMKVTKFGVEAAAATVVSVTRLSAIMPKNPIPITIDRSFYVSILYRDSNNRDDLLPLFTGVVNKV